MAQYSIHSCANPACRFRVPSAKSSPPYASRLCWPCYRRWRKTRLPVAGFVGSLDLQKVGYRFLQEWNPSKSDLADALRILRGTRHRAGDWSNRPAYRLSPLLHTSKSFTTERLPHLLVGRRKAPSKRSLGMGLAHLYLGRSILGVKGPYAHYLAGASFMVRKGLSAPKGVEVLTGGAGHTGYFISISDLSLIGRTVEKAAKAIGIDPEVPLAGEMVTSIYLEGLAAGLYRPPIIVNRWASPTTALGDCAFDHYTGWNPDLPPLYRNKLRRASGAISRVYPTGLDLSWEDIEARRQAILEAERQRYRANRTQYTDEAASTDWLGF